MKIRDLLTKLNHAIRPPHVQGADRLMDDKIDAQTTLAGAGVADTGGYGVGTAPTNWVPSQQDERPRR